MPYYSLTPNAVLPIALLSLLCLPIASVNSQTGTTAHPVRASHSADDFEVLFDGSSLENFRGYRSAKIGAGWKIDGQALMFDGSGGGDIMTKKEYANFELVFEWKVSEGANSGVMYRVSTGDRAPYFSGPEYQVLDDSRHRDGKNELTSAASLYGLYAPAGKELKPVGSWNSAKIVLAGNRVQHWLNGKKVVEAELESADWNERVNNSKFKTWAKFGKNDKGHICFQDHGDKIWFRNIKIRSVSADRP